jgi:hypothetical protein
LLLLLRLLWLLGQWGLERFLVVPRAAASSVLFRERWRVPFKGDFARKL